MVDTTRYQVPGRSIYLQRPGRLKIFSITRKCENFSAKKVILEDFWGDILTIEKEYTWEVGA